MLGLIELGLRGDPRGEEPRLALLLLPGESLGILGRAQLRLALPVGRFERGDLHASGGEVRFGVAHGNSKRCVVEPEQRRAALDECIVADVDRELASRDVRADRYRGGLRVGVVSALILVPGEIEICEARENGRRGSEHERPAHPLQTGPGLVRAHDDGTERSRVVNSSWERRFAWIFSSTEIARSDCRFGIPTSASRRVSSAQRQISSTSGFAFDLRYRQRARRSAGSLRRSTSSSDSIWSRILTRLMGSMSVRSASCTWLMPSLVARY